MRPLPLGSSVLAPPASSAEPLRTPAKAERKKLESLQIGRGIAALMVLLFHSEIVTQAMRPESILKWMFNAGWCGVDYFFVLSGFLMVCVHNRDFDQPSRVFPYLRKRFIRIYPIYWVLCAIILIGGILCPSIPDIRGKLSFPVIASSIFLFPHQGARLLGVTWTLEYEVAFYALFALFLFSRMIGTAIFVVWVCAIVSGSLVFSASVDSSGIPPFQPFGLAFLLNLHCMEFLSGMAAAVAVRRGFMVRRPGLALMLSLGLGSAFLMADTAWGIFQREHRIAIAGYAVSSTLILLFSVLYETRYRPVFPEWLRELGAASYAIYLTHFLVISAAHAAVSRSKVLQDFPAVIVFAVVIPLALAPGVLLHRYVERPLLERLAAETAT